MEDRSVPVLEALWRYKWSSLALAGLLALVSAGVALLLQDQDVTAHARIFLATSPNKVINVAITNEPGLVRYTKQRALFATSEAVLARAAEELGDTTVDDLSSRVTATASSDGGAVVIAATAATAEQAVEICNAVIHAFQAETLSVVSVAVESAINAIRLNQEQRGKSQADTKAASQAMLELSVKVSDIRVDAALFGSGVSFVDPPRVATATQRRSPIWEGAVGLVLGALLAASVAWQRADRDRRVREAEDAADILQVPLLGEVPKLARHEQAALDDLAGMPSVAYQVVASGLQATISGGLVLVTSAEQGEGRTTTAAHVAVAAARDGVRVLVIDADGTSRGLSRLFGLEAEHRCPTALTDRRTSLEECTYSVTVAENQTFSIVSAGDLDQSTPSLFRSSTMANAVREMRRKYDLVVVDAAPLTLSAEAAALARLADGVVVVVRRGASVRALRRLAQQLKLFVAPIVGYVFTFGVPLGFHNWGKPMTRRQEARGHPRMIVRRFSALRPPGRLAGAAGPLHRGEGRGIAGAAPRGGAAAATHSTATAGLGRSGGVSRVDPAAAEAGAQPPVGGPGHSAALAAPPGHEEPDPSESQRPATAARRGRGPDRTAYPGEQVAGILAGPGRAAQAGPPCRRVDHPPDSQATPEPHGAAPPP